MEANSKLNLKPRRLLRSTSCSKGPECTLLPLPFSFCLDPAETHLKDDFQSLRAETHPCLGFPVLLVYQSRVYSFDFYASWMFGYNSHSDVVSESCCYALLITLIVRLMFLRR